MAGQLPFIDIDGQEVANGYRTIAYLLRGLGPWQYEVPELYPCGVLGREVGGVGPFISPILDPAPWYDAAVPESAEFLGFVPRLNFQEITITRTTTQRFGGIAGGVLGVEQLAVKALKVEGMLIASSCPGLEYGRHWLYTKLGSDAYPCTLRTIRVRESCPPADGSNDTRGEKLMYDAAVIAGITRNDDGGDNCCDYDGLAFTIASESPYLFSRAGAASAAVEVQSSAGVLPPLPAILDTMVRANTGPPPSASWTGQPLTGYFNTLRIVSNQLDNSSAVAGGAAYWNAATFGPDCIVTEVVPTRVNGGSFTLFGRITTPGLNLGECAFATFSFQSAGNDFCVIGRKSTAVPMGLQFLVISGGFTFASGDTFALTCRGHLLEAWRKPSGGSWVRIAATYDSLPVPVAGYVGVSIDSVNSVGFHLGAFGAGTLTNGDAYPHDVVSIAVPAVSIGIASPIITVTAPGSANNTGGSYWTNRSVNGVRIQLKKNMAECTQVDAFTVDDLATRWTQSPAGWQITGGKLKPTVTGLNGASGRRILRKLATGGAVAFLGGRVEAKITTGASVTNGVWGVQMGNIGAFLVKTVGAFSNVFMLNNDANGTGGLDSIAFTPLTATTYRVILEVLPTGVVGVYTCVGYLVDTTNAMLVRPIRADVGSVNALGPTFQPGISSAPAGTDEAWDDFFAIDYSDEASYMNANMPPGTLTIDSGRRVTGFKSASSASAPTVEGSAYVSSPLDTPLGWPDLVAGQGVACLQIWAEEGSYPGNTVQVAWQSRVR